MLPRERERGRERARGRAKSRTRRRGREREREREGERGRERERGREKDALYALKPPSGKRDRLPVRGPRGGNYGLLFSRGCALST